MKISQLYCPSCGGSIKGDLNKETIFCPFCGQQLAIDHEKNEITINHNININKTENKTINNNITQHNIDETEIQKSKYDLILIIAVLAFILILFLFH